MTDKENTSKLLIDVKIVSGNIERIIFLKMNQKTPFVFEFFF